MAGVVCRFAQDVAQQRVAGLGDRASMDGFAARVLTRDQPGVGHELSRSLEAPKVASFGDDGDGGEKRDPAQALERRNQRKVRSAHSRTA